ncbi:MAG: DUF1800 family protein, partial [Bacteroidota bacterium]
CFLLPFLSVFITIVALSAQPTPQLIGVGQNSNILITTSDAQNSSLGQNTVSSEGFAPNNSAASRFLQQAAFGPNYNEITALGNIGLENWLEQQFATPRGLDCVDKVTEITNIKNAGQGDPNGGPFLFFWDYAFWEYSMTTPDVLRQRVALALTEILVISQNSGFGDNAYAFASYYDMLLDNAFGNYRDILGAVTRQPAMSLYLTYMNNPRQDTIYELDWGVWPPDTLSRRVTFPDENYAREVMQLFTIGLCELNLDGTCKKDENGIDIPTYDNVDIAEFSKIFTGYTWSNPWCDFGCGSLDFNVGIRGDLVMNNEYHAPGAKNLLNGYVVQPRNPVDGEADIDEALDHLFNHPNVGPFIGKLLIQRLVTSNPSLAYVERVAKAFNGESHYSNQRGDMQAVIKAILLDDEARNCASQSDPNFGMLREPFIRYLQLVHSFDLSSPNGVNRNAMSTIQAQFGQKIFTSPSVFNFFQQDYQPIGPVEEAGLFAPEFQITNSQTISGYMNALNEWLFYDHIVDDWGLGYDGSINDGDDATLDFSTEVTMVDDDKLPELLDRLDLILAHGQISQRTKDAILPILKEMPIIGYNQENTEFLRLNRVRMAIYMIMSSPEYLINK